MDAIENLHYAIGQLAFSVAFSDKKVQKEEREKFLDIVSRELHNKDYAFSVSDIIFRIMDKDQIDSETAYQWAIKEINTNGHYLSPELKAKFESVIEKIAEAYPPVTEAELSIISKFKKDIINIHGDPVYYNMK